MDKVFVELPPRRTSREPVLEWTLDHFDNYKTKIILVPYTELYVANSFRDAANYSYLPRCAEKKFSTEVLIPDAAAISEPVSSFYSKIAELVTKHGMNKFVAPASNWTIRATREAFEGRPNLSCKIWFIKDDRKPLLTTSYNPSNAEIIPEAALVENEKLKKKIKEETELHEKVKKELLEMIEQTKTNKQEIEGLRRDIDQLKQNNELTTTFTFQELEEATKNFNDSLKIGKGESGSVYKGTFRGTTVAIKKFDSQNKPNLSLLQQEVVILSKVRHPNLVTLIGACIEPPVLVYEFLSRGSLRNYLNHAGNTKPLSWQVRTRIICEVCVALIFLHSNKPNPIVHGDLRPDNILLDANFTSKLSDFGLIKQVDTDNTTSHPTKTYAYMDPEYFTTEEMTRESDVYSFGVLILHLLTGTSRLNIGKSVKDTMGNDKFRTTIDESAGKWPLDHAKQVAEIGVWCANVRRSKRPDLASDVWPSLECLLKFPDEDERGDSSFDQGPK